MLLNSEQTNSEIKRGIKSYLEQSKIYATQQKQS